MSDNYPDVGVAVTLSVTFYILLAIAIGIIIAATYGIGVLLWRTM